MSKPGDEIGRTKGFESGEVTCIKCGTKQRFYWNGGELDAWKHCGVYYRTEHQATDLVIYDTDPPEWVD